MRERIMAYLEDMEYRCWQASLSPFNTSELKAELDALIIYYLGGQELMDEAEIKK